MKKKVRRPRIPAQLSKLPDNFRSLESAQGRCPQGHPLPNHTAKGRCTPVHCAGDMVGETNPISQERVELGRLGAQVREAKKEAMTIVSNEADVVIDSLIPGESVNAMTQRAAAKAQKGEELIRIAHSIGRYAALRATFKVPEGLEGADAEAWVQKRAMMLSVDALVDLERDLKLGDDAQRREARRDLLDMNGMRKREAVAGGQAVIMLVGTNGTQLQVPWAQKPVSGETVDGKATPALPSQVDPKQGTK